MAATESSFDIVSKADPQEVKNAIQQAQREIETRFDFRNSVSKIEHDEKETITLHSDDETRLQALTDVLQSKLIKRGVDVRFLDYGKLEQATKGTVRQVVTIKRWPADGDGQEDRQADQGQGPEGTGADSRPASARGLQKQGRFAGRHHFTQRRRT